MGVWKEREIALASTAFNLAGPDADRPGFLKSVVVNSILNNSKSLGEDITAAYTGGPGLKLRRFVDWAAADISRVGIPVGTLASAPDINSTVVKSYLPVDSRIDKIEFDVARPDYYAEQYMLENHPTLFNGIWSYDVIGSDIMIIFADETTVTFTPVGFDPDAAYIYVTYSHGYGASQVGPIMWIYEIGSGNVDLDAEVTSGSDLDQFYPCIPVRFDNEFIYEHPNPHHHARSKLALKKAIGADIEDIEVALEDHPDLADIDNATVIFGVSANTSFNDERKYLYEFIKKLRLSQVVGISDYNTFIASRVDYDNFQTEFGEWKLAYDSFNDGEGEGSPDPPPDPGPPPAHVDAPALPKNSLRLQSGNKNLYLTSMDVEISWVSIDEDFGAGLGKPGATVGEVWFEDGGSESYAYEIRSVSDTILADNETVGIVLLYKQISPTEWSRLAIRGMRHKNLVYRDKFIEIDLADAIDDANISGFIFPLHEETFNELSLKECTELSMGCAFLVINSYEIVKPSILGSLLFKLFIIAIIVAITVATGGFGAGSVGILGANAAVGAAIGLTGVAAIIVGAIANALAAMIITSLITKGATLVFGDKFGQIIGVVASMLALNGFTNMANGGNFAINFGQLSTAQVLMQATSSVGQGVTGYMGAKVQARIEATQDLIDEFDEESKRISELYAENFGYGKGVIDTMALTDAARTYSESASNFLSRTLMTGSDISELSMSMVSNFSEISLNTDLPL